MEISKMTLKCSCLQFCGEDPRAATGHVYPCDTLQSELDTQNLKNAAPALLASLKTILSACDDPNNSLDTYAEEFSAARDAIRKAEEK